MAADIRELAIQLSLEKINIMGHDIGGMVTMSFAFNYPEMTEKLIVLDGSYPSAEMLQMPLIPAPGTFSEKMDAAMPYAWWMGLNQVRPARTVNGRAFPSVAGMAF